MKGSHTRLLGSARLTLPGSGCCLCPSPPVCVLTSLSLYLCLYLCLCLLYLWLFLCVFLSVFMALGMEPRTLCKPDKHCNADLCPFPFYFSLCVSSSLFLSLCISLSHCFYFFLLVSICFTLPPFCVSVSWSLSLSPPLLSLSASFLSHHLCICSPTSGDAALKACITC